MIVAVGVWILLSLIEPWVLSDNNKFMADFVNQELLAFLGVVVTITLASAANLHLELNKMEEKVNKRVFAGTRTAVKRSASWLIGMMLIALVLVVAKPLMCHSEIAEAFVNGGALLIVFFNVLVLVDLTHTAFAIEPAVGK